MAETPSPNPGSDFLKQKYDLHNKPEVESAARRTEIRTGEAVPDDAAERIQNYLDRFTEILEREDPDKRKRGIDALKQVLYREFVIAPQDVPQSHYDLQGEIASNEGRRQDLLDSHVRIVPYTTRRKVRNPDGGREWQDIPKAHYYFPEKIRQELARVVVEDQQHSLDAWVDYLASTDATYPLWLKYYAVRGVLELGRYDKKVANFRERVTPSSK